MGTREGREPTWFTEEEEEEVEAIAKERRQI
jgi:hypothetical protein